MSRSGYEWADTEAATMLAAGFRCAREQRGLSIRQIGKLLGYKQAVVLSHMANGKTPIPIDRAEELAQTLELSTSEFLRAVVSQRHPQVNWNLLATVQSAPVPDPFASRLEVILGVPLDELSAEQREVLQEVASDRSPSRRWLSVGEIPLLDAIRKRGDLSDPEINEILEQLARQDGLGK